MKTHTKTLLATLTACTALAGTNQAATITNVNASNATYIRSNDANTNFQTSTFNVANDNGTHRVALWTFDISSITDTITDVTITLEENIGGGTEEYEVFGLGDGSLNLNTITWNIAVTDGVVASNRPVGTSLATFDAAGGTATYSVGLTAAFFDGDADGLITIGIADNVTNTNGIGWTDGAVLNVTSVPEPGSLALLGLGGLLIARRRRG